MKIRGLLPPSAKRALGRTVRNGAADGRRIDAIQGDENAVIQEFPALWTDYDPETGRCAWTEQTFDPITGARITRPLGKFGTFTSQPAFPVGPGPVPPDGLADGIEVWLRARIYSAELGQTYEFDWPGGTEGFWALLTAKTYNPGESIEYEFQRLATSDDPVILTWVDIDDDADTPDGVAYQARNLDLPVSISTGGSSSGTDFLQDLSVVWIRKESGATWVIGPNDPTAAASNAPGDVAWSNPTNVFSSNDSRATAALTSGQTTECLDVTGFGFEVPDGKPVIGIKVEVERSRAGSNTNLIDQTIQLLSSGSAVGDNKADAGTPWPATDTYASYGGTADDWDAGLEADDVNDSTFGVRIRATLSSGSETARVDHVRVTVYYADDRNVFDEVPWEDLFRLTGDTDDDGAVAFHRYFDQNTGSWEDGREVRVIQAE